MPGRPLLSRHAHSGLPLVSRNPAKHSPREELWECINGARSFLASPGRCLGRSADSPLSLGVALEYGGASEAVRCSARGDRSEEGCAPYDVGMASGGWDGGPPQLIGGGGARAAAGAAKSPPPSPRRRRSQKGVRMDPAQARQQKLLLHAAQGLVPLEVAIRQDAVAGRAELRRRIAQVRDALEQR